MIKNHLKFLYINYKFRELTLLMNSWSENNCYIRIKSTWISSWIRNLGVILMLESSVFGSVTNKYFAKEISHSLFTTPKIPFSNLHTFLPDIKESDLRVFDNNLLKKYSKAYNLKIGSKSNYRKQ